ncbi:3-oxoacyl-[acyl-carrier protein] reductase [Cystobacter fuscus DSM 2262]|uniref:3-oxoacyl-[acyl-carrier protein] reductase n=1 Tax=Cystobacter fuscus (strain ATCC 25194 / DSM 2262 / NBRC 100088 / M29) TaxID=1242864 RepID=S9P9C6_CYSF2|nr:SDR family NAD(P)-dependent oxidoreductase [Cystobacter fuscus]EPX59701.1 3-oxoacyl-[acyl-carrier protein] reductase [Cystobacter fuscus DSM 2262]
MSELSYRTALVTGASSGLGRGLALWLGKRGVKVYAAARRLPRLETLAQEGKALGATIEPVELDVSQADATLARVRELDEACGGLDLVVANAGVGFPTNALDFPWEDAKRIIDVNVTGAAATLSAVLPRMVERDRGHLVGISSLASCRGLPQNAAYSASKAFLDTFLESLRVDLHGTRVRVTCIRPGFVKTEITAAIQHYMPFLLEADPAVEYMGQAILRGDDVYGFPWPMARAVGMARWVPNALFDAVASKVL